MPYPPRNKAGSTGEEFNAISVILYFLVYLFTAFGLSTTVDYNCVYAKSMGCHKDLTMLESMVILNIIWAVPSLALLEKRLNVHCDEDVAILLSFSLSVVFSHYVLHFSKPCF